MARPCSAARPAHIPEKARFPVIDAHNHLFADMPAEEMTRIMDAVGVRVFLNLTGNCALPFDDKGYTIRRRDFADYKSALDDGGSRAGLPPSRWRSSPGGTTSPWISTQGFAEQCVAALEADVRPGRRWA